jgi:hypothetical protein
MQLRKGKELEWKKSRRQIKEGRKKEGRKERRF